MEATQISEQQPRRVSIEGVDGLSYSCDPDCRYLILVPSGYKVSRETATTITEKLKDIGVQAVLIAGDDDIKVFELERGR